MRAIPVPGGADTRTPQAELLKRPLGITVGECGCGDSLTWPRWAFMSPEREKSCLLGAGSSEPSAVWPLLTSASGLGRASLESSSAVLNVSSLHNLLAPMCLCIAEAACSPICPRKKLRKLLLVWFLVHLESLSAVLHCLAQRLLGLSLELLCHTDRRSCGPASLPLPVLVMAPFCPVFCLDSDLLCVMSSVFCV